MTPNFEMTIIGHSDRVELSNNIRCSNCYGISISLLYLVIVMMPRPVSCRVPRARAVVRDQFHDLCIQYLLCRRHLQFIFKHE